MIATLAFNKLSRTAPLEVLYFDYEFTVYIVHCFVFQCNLCNTRSNETFKRSPTLLNNFDGNILAAAVIP